MNRASAPLGRLFPLGPVDWAVVADGDPLPIIVNRDDVMVGINAFEPGEEFPNHSHSVVTETFIGIHGVVELWLDRSECVELGPGVVRIVPPHEEHYLRNAAEEQALIMYVKTPARSDDRIPAVWKPVVEGMKE